MAPKFPGGGEVVGRFLFLTVVDASGAAREPRDVFFDDFAGLSGGMPATQRFVEGLVGKADGFLAAGAPNFKALKMRLNLGQFAGSTTACDALLEFDGGALNFKGKALQAAPGDFGVARGRNVNLESSLFLLLAHRDHGLEGRTAASGWARITRASEGIGMTRPWELSGCFCARIHGGDGIKD